jgi:sec-independent protein translocase protein TatA
MSPRLSRGDSGVVDTQRHAGRLAMDLGGPELLIVLVLVLLLFGGTQLPKLARSIGQAQKEFKKGLNEGFVDEDKAPPAKAAPVTEVKVVEKIVERVVEKPSEPTVTEPGETPKPSL